jgi:hypothetical protein
MTLHLDLNASQSNNINNDLWLCTWLWMPTYQMTLTMISDSAPGFECQPIKWHEQWSVTQHLDFNANQSNDINNDPWLCTWLWMPTNQMTLTMIGWHWNLGAESRIIVHVIWLVGIQIQVVSHWSLLMSFDRLAFKVRCRVRDHC